MKAVTKFVYLCSNKEKVVMCNTQYGRQEKGQRCFCPQIVDNARFVHAGCGVNALSDLQKRKNSIYCRVHVGLISIAHQAILRLSSSGQRCLSPDDEEKLCVFFYYLCFRAFEEGIGQTRHQRTGNNCYQVTQYRRNSARDQQNKQTTVWCHQFRTNRH